jgi:NO-binding membrane sensor protein with MHYT domain
MMGTYNSAEVILSFACSFLGAFIAISGCEELRGVYLRNPNPSMSHVVHYYLLIGMSLGGVGIWGMHFIGMGSMQLYSRDGDEVDIEYNIGVSIFSILVAVTMVCIGVAIASHDRVYAKSKGEIIELFSNDLGELTISEIRNVSPSQLLFLACTKELHYLILGSLFAASGVGIMHYVGMAAIEFPGTIEWNIGVIAASVFMAIIVAIIGFWILFRLLSIYPHIEGLRFISAIIMAIAVCGTHYVGMLAANFIVDEAAVNHHRLRASLGWRTSTLSQSDGLIPVILSIFITLWIFTIYLFRQLRMRLR